MKIYALIPAFNEENNIQKVIHRLKKLNMTPVVVDDGSQDKTFELAKKSGAVIIRHKKNKGKGEALKTGFDFILKNYSDVDVILLIDADMQYPPEESKKLIIPIKQGRADFVTGYRNWSRDVPFRHSLGNFIWRNFFNFLFGTHFKDTNCGLMALSKKAAKKMKQ